MKISLKDLTISSNQEVDIINITDEIKKQVKESNINNGVVNIFSQHTTIAFYINEDEPNLREDIETLLEKLVPKGVSYQHNLKDDNADSHLRSIILLPFVILPIEKGEISLGTWQNIMCIDLDGPRKRRIRIQIIGER